MAEETMPYVKEVDGQLVLVDPMAYAVFKAVAKHNCEGTLKANWDWVEHFKVRLTQVDEGATKKYAILVLCVDDQLGAALASKLMPDMNWAKVARDNGQIPVARGLGERAGLADILEHLDKEVAEDLRTLPDPVALVIDHGTAVVFPV